MVDQLDLRPLSKAEIEEALNLLGASPQDHGKVEMIVCRPDIGVRQLLDRAKIDLQNGLLGDNWRVRGSKHTADGGAHPEAQIAIMNSRVITAIAGDRSLWQWAGDQLFVDLDLSVDNLATGQQLSIGTVILEVAAYPHNGCQQFTERFGSGATQFVNSPEGRHARRRGVNTKVIQPGIIQTGDIIKKL